MPLGLGSGFWAIVRPVEKTNYLQNPSGEYGTQGWGTVQAGTVGTTSQFQQFGAWSGSVAPTSNGTAGAHFGTFTAGDGSVFTVSAYVRGANGIPYVLAVGDTSNANFQGSVLITGGGTWQRYNFSYTESGGGTRRIIVKKNSDADTSAFYVDGIMVESGSLTTYVDGDQPGGTWTGAYHNSPSFRTGQYRGGGSVVALADLGWQVDQMPGVGAPPIEVSVQSYAVVDGGQFQRQRAAARPFTLTAKPWLGTTTQDFHRVRAALFDTIKPDAVTPQQPVRFLYVGGQGTVQLDAYYQSGFELGNMDGPIAEQGAVSFLATDPYWYAPTQEGTTFAANTALGSTNYIVKRSPSGAWGTLGANGSAINDQTPALLTIETLAINAGGTLFLGGYWGTLAGTVGGHAIGMYYPQTNRFGTLTGGTVGNGGAQPTVRALAFAPSGTLFIVGNTLTHGGTTSPNAGFWNGVFGTLTGGTIDVNNQGYSAAYSPTGTLFIGGNFLNAGGTTAPRLTMWANGVFGTLSQNAGTLTGRVDEIAWALDNSLYISGLFGSAGGTFAGSIARWNGNWGTLGAGANSGVAALGIKPDGRIAVGGGFTSIGGITTPGIAEWTGAGFSPVASGVTGYINAIGVRQDNSYIAAGSFSDVGGIAFPDPVALWTGAAFQPIGIDLPGATPRINAILEAPDKTLYLAGIFSGTATAATAGSMVNTGRSLAYPTVRFRNLASGTARIWYLQNFTLNVGLYFNLSLLPGEVAWLNLEPGNRSFTSSFRSNLFSAILPGSNLSTWALQPGTNSLAFFADNTGLETSLFYSPRLWSVDGGTVY